MISHKRRMGHACTIEWTSSQISRLVDFVITYPYLLSMHILDWRFLGRSVTYRSNELESLMNATCLITDPQLVMRFHKTLSLLVSLLYRIISFNTAISSRPRVCITRTSILRYSNFRLLSRRQSIEHPIIGYYNGGADNAHPMPQGHSFQYSTRVRAPCENMKEEEYTCQMLDDLSAVCAYVSSTSLNTKNTQGSPAAENRDINFILSFFSQLDAT
jgi:hypothetical protein